MVEGKALRSGQCRRFTRTTSRNFKGNRVAYTRSLLDRKIGLDELRPELRQLTIIVRRSNNHLGLLYAHLGAVSRSVQKKPSSSSCPALLPACRAGPPDLFRATDRRLRGDPPAPVGGRWSVAIPLVFIASMPRSASASLTQSIAATLGSFRCCGWLGADLPYYVPSCRRWL
jgi:hypothetical protein